MIDEQQILTRLGATAEKDRPPAIDVTETVMRRIGRRGKRDVMLWTFSAVSAAAAMVAVAFTVRVVLMRLQAIPDLATPLLGVLP